MGFKQGLYTPKHPQKYVGDITKIRYLSSWELRMHRFLDFNTKVLKWSSEPFPVHYLKPIYKKTKVYKEMHRYYPDYWVKYVNNRGQIVQEVLEIKPSTQARRSRRRNPRAKLYEDMVYSVNLAKWEACRKYCNKYGVRFRVITENNLFR